MHLGNTNKPDFHVTGIDTKKKLNLSFGSQKFNFDANWVIQKLIPASSIGILVGNTGSYKTFVAVAMLCAIATGKKFGQESTDKGFCVLVSGEGGSINIGRRVKAWEEKNNTEVGKNLLRIDQALNPLDNDDYQAICEIIAEHVSTTGSKPLLIVFDTLSQCASGLDENSAASMSLFLKACNALTAETGAAILLVHHNSKTGGYRGSGALECNVDFMLTLEKCRDELATKLAVQKMKDGDTELIYQIEMDLVDLGKIDQFGEKVSSLAINALTKLSYGHSRKEPLRVIDADKIIIMKMVTESSEINRHTKTGYKSLRTEFIRLLSDEQSIIETTASNRFNKSFKSLIEDNILKRNGDNIELQLDEQISQKQLSFSF